MKVKDLTVGELKSLISDTSQPPLPDGRGLLREEQGQLVDQAEGT